MTSQLNSTLKKILPVALLCAMSNSHAAAFSSIPNLDIGGTAYDVTFHQQDVSSFNDLWDSNNDKIFGNDSSLFNATPTFFGNSSGAQAAATAITAFLGTTHWNSSAMSDRIYVPYGYFGNGNLETWGDGNPALDTDQTIILAIGPAATGNATVVFPSFELSSASEISAPLTSALLLSGFAAFGFGKRDRKPSETGL